KIPADTCFRKGEAVLRKESYEIFSKLGTILRMISGKIIIDALVGNTTQGDDRVIKANNLSIDRAANICDYLVKHEDIMQKRFAISGYQIADPKERNIITMVVFKK
ncbi:MAG: OmpA family protein, partial [Planctomycetota bacterium]